MEKYKEAWDQVIEQFEIAYDEQVFNEIIKDTKYHDFSNGYLNILAPTEFVKTKINKLYIKFINQLLVKELNETVACKIITKDDIKPVIKNKIVNQSDLGYRNNLKREYRFDNFVVGNSNMFPFRMAMKIADQPGEVANPFYIFGSVGLGKTHLMQSIGNYILDADLNKNILYIKADQFIEDYTKFCNKEFLGFEEKYRNLDVLFIDDIQILEIGKKSQLEFFRVFDMLISENKQIVITSDRPARELNIMERLTSRFDAGLTVDIQAPNLEHRVNILRTKARETTENDVPDDILEFIASKFTNNIRELEGALTRVLFYSTTCNLPLTLELTKEALQPLIANIKISDSHSEKNINSVLDIVASFYSISLDELIGVKRQAKFVLARHIAMYILKSDFGLSYKKIGAMFSGRDHSTVMSACGKIENELKTSDELQLAVDTILKKIK